MRGALILIVFSSGSLLAQEAAPKLLTQFPPGHRYAGLGSFFEINPPLKITKDTTPPYRPRHDAFAMSFDPYLEVFTGLKLPGQDGPHTAVRNPIRLRKPEYVLLAKELGIVNEYDVLFLGKAKALYLRLQLGDDEYNLSELWSKKLKQIFEYLDRDGDGYLNRFEGEHVFSTRMMNDFLLTGQLFPRPGERRDLADFDLDDDGKINLAEFMRFYAPVANSLIRTQDVSNLINNQNSPTMNDDLLAKLDTNKDGKISKAELEQLRDQLGKLDLDDDECISLMELLPELGNPGRVRRPVPAPKTPATNPAPLADTIFVFRHGEMTPRMVEAILKRYDLNADNQLQPDEWPFERDLFKTLDKNATASVNRDELTDLGAQAPLLQLKLRLSSIANRNTIAMSDPKPAMNPGAKSPFQLIAPTAAQIAVDQQLFSVRISTAPAIPRTQPLVPFIQFPDNGKGYITEADIIGPQFQLFRVIFDTCDRNGDGRVDKAEYDLLTTLQNRFNETTLQINFSSSYPNLFSMIDENRDGRLSYRELTTAYSRLKVFDPNANGGISKDILAPQGTILYGKSSTIFTDPSMLSPLVVSTRAPGRGPVWFQKFDRNGDGEVSLKEFPGSLEQFKKIDTNDDGYISYEEALAADKANRKESKGK